MRAKTHPPDLPPCDRALQILRLAASKVEPEQPEVAFAAFEEYLLELCVEEPTA